jgi:hypothetical protein
MLAEVHAPALPRRYASVNLGIFEAITKRNNQPYKYPNPESEHRKKEVQKMIRFLLLAEQDRNFRTRVRANGSLDRELRIHDLRTKRVR